MFCKKLLLHCIYIVNYLFIFKFLPCKFLKAKIELLKHYLFLVLIMTSHASHIQYQQQRINNLNKTGSLSSIQFQDNVHTNSVLSGSSRSSKIRSQISSVGNTYQNIIKSSRIFKQLSYSTINEKPQNISEINGSHKNLDSATNLQSSTMFPKSVQSTKSLYLPSQFKMSRSLKASKVNFIICTR